MHTPDPVDLWLYRFFITLVALVIPFLLAALVTLFVSIFQ